MNAHACRTGVLVSCVLMGVVGITTSCDTIDSPAGPSRHVHGTAIAPTGAGTPEASVADEATPAAADVGPELAAVRHATARFHVASEAFAAGYTIPAGEPCVAIPSGAMGIHAPNPGLIADQALDPTRPELLLYLPKPGGGGLRLLGVEYLQFVLVRSAPGAAPTPWVSPDFANPAPWPAHYEVVSPAPQLFGQSFGDYHAGHTPTMPWHWDLHAWIWAHNPDGVFAPFNPAISCN